MFHYAFGHQAVLHALLRITHIFETCVMNIYTYTIDGTIDSEGDNSLRITTVIAGTQQDVPVPSANGWIFLILFKNSKILEVVHTEDRKVYTSQFTQ
jgi:hypothetical protein